MYPGELIILMSVISERKVEEMCQRIYEQAKAALVPHMKEERQRAFFRALEKPRKMRQNKNEEPVTKESIESDLANLKMRSKILHGK